jgi:hypothetical protein
MVDTQRFASADNTEVPCFAALREFGFEVRRQERGGVEAWIAARSGIETKAQREACGAQVQVRLCCARTLGLLALVSELFVAPSVRAQGSVTVELGAGPSIPHDRAGKARDPGYGLQRGLGTARDRVVNYLLEATYDRLAGKTLTFPAGQTFTYGDLSLRGLSGNLILAAPRVSNSAVFRVGAGVVRQKVEGESFAPDALTLQLGLGITHRIGKSALRVTLLEREILSDYVSNSSLTPANIVSLSGTLSRRF